jgi:hypothetical protein
MSADIPRPYLEWDAIFRDCVECAARVGELCVNPISGVSKRLPCVARTKPEETEQ